MTRPHRCALLTEEYFAPKQSLAIKESKSGFAQQLKEALECHVPRLTVHIIRASTLNIEEICILYQQNIFLVTSETGRIALLKYLLHNRHITNDYEDSLFVAVLGSQFNEMSLKDFRMYLPNKPLRFCSDTWDKHTLVKQLLEMLNQESLMIPLPSVRFQNLRTGPIPTEKVYHIEKVRLLTLVRNTYEGGPPISVTSNNITGVMYKSTVATGKEDKSDEQLQGDLSHELWNTMLLANANKTSIPSESINMNGVNGSLKASDRGELEIVRKVPTKSCLKSEKVSENDENFAKDPHCDTQKNNLNKDLMGSYFKLPSFSTMRRPPLEKFHRLNYPPIIDRGETDYQKNPGARKHYNSMGRLSRRERSVSFEDEQVEHKVDKAKENVCRENSVHNNVTGSLGNISMATTSQMEKEIMEKRNESIWNSRNWEKTFRPSPTFLKYSGQNFLSLSFKVCKTQTEPTVKSGEGNTRPVQEDSSLLNRKDEKIEHEEINVEQNGFWNGKHRLEPEGESERELLNSSDNNFKMSPSIDHQFTEGVSTLVPEGLLIDLENDPEESYFRQPFGDEFVTEMENFTREKNDTYNQNPEGILDFLEGTTQTEEDERNYKISNEKPLQTFAGDSKHPPRLSDLLFSFNDPWKLQRLENKIKPKSLDGNCSQAYRGNAPAMESRVKITHLNFPEVKMRVILGSEMRKTPLELSEESNLSSSSKPSEMTADNKSKDTSISIMETFEQKVNEELIPWMFSWRGVVLLALWFLVSSIYADMS